MRGIGLTRRLLLATVIAGTGCAHNTSWLEPRPFPGSASAAGAGARATARVQARVARALAMQGATYRAGGETPRTGFDCSGLVRFVFLEERIELPRTVVEQFRAGRAVERSHVQAGDLIFFRTTVAGPSHVGIAVDGFTFVHAPGAGAVVRVERFDTPYWTRRLAGVRRVAGL